MALNIVNVNFGNTPLTGTIAGIKFNDTNRNGLRDAGEVVIPGVQIFIDNNNNGRLDTGEPVSVTNAQGGYSFSGLAAGLYRIREVAPAGFTQTTPNPDINLAPGQNTSADFGNAPPQIGSIAGVKFNDANRNGVRDAGEIPIAGVQIFIDNNNNGRLDAGEPLSITNAQGSYGFGGLAPGLYRIREVAPAGFTQTTGNPDINLAAGQNVGADFGNAPPQLGSISGVKFNDTNRNGARDAGEVVIPGVSIFIDNNNNGTLDPGEPVSVTNAQGGYGFGGLAAGLYRIREVAPAGFTQTTPNPDINLAPGQNTSADFGNAPPQIGSIAGVKFNDANRNGVRDAGEIPIAGVQIFIDNNNNGRLDAGEPLSITNAQGSYGFGGLAPGLYRIREVAPAGFTQTTGNPDINLAAGQNVGADFGNAPPQLGSITGTKFNDANRNGVRDAGEIPIAGVQIFIDNNNNGILEAGEPVSVTNAQGGYGFAGLPVGLYRIREVVPAGFTRTTPNPDITLAGGQNTSADFGNAPILGSISGFKFNDLNANGIREVNEPPLSGVQIYLDLNNNRALNPGEPSTFTNAQGAYSFQGLAPGTYFVREIQPAGFRQTTPDPLVVTINPATGGANFDFLTGSVV